MTTPCLPHTIEAALRIVLAALGPKQAAALIDRDVHYVRSLSNPTSRYRLTVADQMQLDLAYNARFGGFPIHDMVTAILSARRAAKPVALDLTAPTASVALETGQAVAAMIVAANAGSTLQQRRVAAQEWEEAQVALARCGPVLHALLSGPSP
ncbi:hypothetical protein ACVOMT_16520 [Sphingomonas panni]